MDKFAGKAFTAIRRLGYKLTNAGGLAFKHGYRKYLLAVVAAFAVVIGVLVYRGHFHKAVEAAVESEDNRVAAEVLTTARRADEAAQAKSDGIRAGIANKEVRERRVTETALQKHADWAAEPVPADVLVSLHDEDAPQN